ncbi:MAG: hypothetical protein ACREA0_16660, partial [bacterium]
MSSRRRRTILHLAAALCSMIVFAPPAAAQNENETVGFQSNHIFEGGHFGENIDILNGGVNLTIPIGQRYQVNAQLGYGLTLAYSSKIWDSTYYKNLIIDDANQRTIPYNESPFGIGFAVTFGRIFWDRTVIELTCDTEKTPTCMRASWKWVSPDGAQHEFYADSGLKTVYRGDPLESYVHIGANGLVDRFDGRISNDLSFTRFWGPEDTYCKGLKKEDGVTPETGCFLVQTPDGLEYTLVKRVECQTLPIDPTFNSPQPGYQQARADNVNFCGWYTALIE